jgi:hypothetical protein
MIRELLTEGKGGSVSARPEEAGEQNCKPTDRNRISRPSLWGELAPHSEAFRSGDMVNAAVVQGKSMTLSGEISSTLRPVKRKRGGWQQRSCSARSQERS